MGHDERTYSTCALHHEDQSRGSSREKVFRVDRRVDPVIIVHFPADVDLERGVRRVWPNNRTPQVLLMYFFIFCFAQHRSCRMDRSKVHAVETGTYLTFFLFGDSVLHANSYRVAIL